MGFAKRKRVQGVTPGMRWLLGSRLLGCRVLGLETHPREAVAAMTSSGIWFRVEGLRFRVQGLGLRVEVEG